MFDKGI